MFCYFIIITYTDLILGRHEIYFFKLPSISKCHILNIFITKEIFIEIPKNSETKVYEENITN